MVTFLIIVCIVASLFVWYAQILTFLAAVWFFFVELSLFGWIREHPWQALLYAAGYFLIGAAWSVAKWYFAESSRAREARASYKTLMAKTPSEAVTWEEYINRWNWKGGSAIRYSEDIKWWIALWPFSATWTLLDDPVRRLVHRIYYELQGVYQRVSDYVWRRAGA